jgi:hypothetical protein
VANCGACKLPGVIKLVYIVWLLSVQGRREDGVTGEKDSDGGKKKDCAPVMSFTTLNRT